MTDAEIGKMAREIAERGNTAEVKQNKNGIVVLEVKKVRIPSNGGRIGNN